MIPVGGAASATAGDGGRGGVEPLGEADVTFTIKEAYSRRPDLKDVPPEDPDWGLYADESSFVRDGKQMTVYTVTTMDMVIKGKGLAIRYFIAEN
ncbi:unnamed protein product [Coccothraustes coccothraustes]